MKMKKDFRTIINETGTSLLNRVHIAKWIPTYTKFDFVSDFIAGITVGLTMMPQAIAYASLAGLPAQYGLYTAFIGSFAYIFFGTIKEVSIGPTSLMALLVFSYTEGLHVDYIILLCFLCGIIQLLMGIFKLGFLVDFIPMTVTSGFTSAMSLIIILTQTKGLLGLKFTNHGVPDLIKQLCLNITSLKTPDALLGISSIVFLLTFRSFTKIKVKSPLAKKILWVLSISRNALLVFITSIIAFCFKKYNGEVPFRLSGEIKSGLPTINLPPFSTIMHNETISFTEMTSTLGSSILVVPIVGVLANVAIAKAFTSGTVVDATQEMITLGICNILGSFFQAMPACGAFTRSAVSSSSGIRTPMGGLYAGVIILLALSFLTPYFYYIPRSALSAVLISAVMFMIDYEIIPKLWRCNRFDLVIVTSTFIFSMIFGVETGLFIGCLINLISLLRLWTRPYIVTVYYPSEKKKEYIVIKPEIGLLYPGIDYFTEEVARLSTEGVPIIIDFANVLKIDYSACIGILNMIKTFQKRGQEMMFFNVRTNILKKLKSLEDDTNKIYLCENLKELTLQSIIEIDECDTPLLNTTKAQTQTQTTPRPSSSKEEDFNV